MNRWLQRWFFTTDGLADMNVRIAAQWVDLGERAWCPKERARCEAVAARILRNAAYIRNEVLPLVVVLPFVALLALLCWLCEGP